MPQDSLRYSTARPAVQGMRSDMPRRWVCLLILSRYVIEGVIEKLQASIQMAWVGTMENIRNAAEEIVLRELIYM